MFQELRETAEVKFRFAEEEDACEYVTRLAAELHLFAPAHALKVVTPSPSGMETGFDNGLSPLRPGTGLIWVRDFCTIFA